jgi:hypothetical protein
VGERQRQRQRQRPGCVWGLGLGALTAGGRRWGLGRVGNSKVGRRAGVGGSKGVEGRERDVGGMDGWMEGGMGGWVDGGMGGGMICPLSAG